MVADDEPTRLFSRGRSPELTVPCTSHQHVPTRLEVQVTSRSNTRRLFRLALGRYRIGTHDSCDIVIDDPWASREHLELDVSEDEVRVTDLSSTNGSYHNGARFEDRTFDVETSVLIGKSRLRMRPLRTNNAPHVEQPTLVPVVRREPELTNPLLVWASPLRHPPLRARRWHRLTRVAFVMLVASVFTTASFVAYPSMLDQVCDQYDGLGGDAARVVRQHARSAHSAFAELFEPLAHLDAPSRFPGSRIQ